MNCKYELSFTCSSCICQSCLFFKSGRCPYGSCYDDKRATEDPFDKAHPDRPPRTLWSNWKTEQMYWCRGGSFYPVNQCESYKKYTGAEVKECLKAPVVIYQDGYINCSLVETLGCEACYNEHCERIDRNEIHLHTTLCT